MTEASTYLTGLDLGQAQDYTALAIVERTVSEDDEDEPVTRTFDAAMRWMTTERPFAIPKEKKTETRYAVRHLERFELGTSYPAICKRVVELFAEPRLKNGTLLVDQTGVGRPVVDMLRRARPKARIRPITITSGNAVVPDGAGYHVPKKDLVSAMQVLFQSRRIQVARSLPNADVLVKELESFRVKITMSANETFEAWRDRDHDDLVLAVALAAWKGDHGLKELWIA
jgi:hypothetical protein